MFGINLKSRSWAESNNMNSNKALSLSLSLSLSRWVVHKSSGLVIWQSKFSNHPHATRNIVYIGDDIPRCCVLAVCVKHDFLRLDDRNRSLSREDIWLCPSSRYVSLFHRSPKTRWPSINNFISSSNWQNFETLKLQRGVLITFADFTDVYRSAFLEFN